MDKPVYRTAALVIPGGSNIVRNTSVTREGNFVLANSGRLRGHLQAPLHATAGTPGRGSSDARRGQEKRGSDGSRTAGADSAFLRSTTGVSLVDFRPR
jgi:hypothetical protein